MSIVLEDSNLNVAEQVNVLFKSSLGFPSTKESTPWFQETSVKYNNYVNGEEILLDEIPSNPSFSVTPNLVDVNVSSSQLATGGYIKEDSTRVIRQYHRLILTPVPNSSNNSYYALDSEGNNILTDGLQFNTKWIGSGDKIYPYTLYTEAFINADSSAPNELGQDSTGGNWLYDLKNGVIFFPDYSSSLCNGTTNKPVFSFYKYIGRKGVAKQIDFKNSLLDIPNTTKKYDKQIVVQTNDNTIHRYDSSTSSWIPIGGSGGGGVWEESSSNSNIFYNSSGSVGIGTDNPQAKLHIAHAEGVSEDIISLRAEGTIRTYTPDADSHIRSEITSHHQGGKLLLYDGYSNTNTNEIQVQLSAKINEYNYINNGGRVGIGITVPQAVLHVAQKNAVWNATSNPDPVTLRVEGGILVTDVDADVHHRVKIESDGQILIYGGYSPNETAIVKISGNNHENNDGKTYFNAGNVGIGTDDPGYSLDVYNGGATAYINTKINASKNTYFGTYSGYGFLKSVGNHLRIGGDDEYQMQLHSDKVMINNPLHITADSYVQAIKFRYYPSYNFDIASIETEQNGSTSYEANMMFKLCNGQNNFEEKMRITNDGKVGIGTASPGSKLEIFHKFSSATHTTLPVDSDNIGSNESVGLFLSKQWYNNTSFRFGLAMGTLSDGKSYIQSMSNTSTGRVLLLNPNSAGNVGIGTNNPGAKLDVNGSTYLDYMETSSWIYIKGSTGHWPLPSTSGYRWNKYWSRTGATWVDSFPIALRIDSGSIYSQNDPVLHTNSDIRIKKDIEEVPDNLSLEMVRNIPCKYYKYIDEGRNIKNNDTKVIGFIAQEVKEVFPLAVDLVNDFEPNENRLLENISWEKIIDNSNNVCKYKLTSDLQDVSGVKYKFYMVNDPSGNVPETKKEVIGNNDNTFTFDNSWNYVFCVGREINDFHALDKSKLFTLNFSATQEIDRIQQKQLLDISQNKIDIETLKIENDNLKLQNSTLTTKVNNLQSELTNLKSIVQGLIEAQMSS